MIGTLTETTYIVPGFDNFELELCQLSISHLQKYNTIHINLQVQVIKVHDDVSPLVHGEVGWNNFGTTLRQLSDNFVTTLRQHCLRLLCKNMSPLWRTVK